MIDINELRRKVNSTDIVDHIDLHANIKTTLSEMIDRLEAAEKERDWHAERCEDAMNECDALRAKVAEMERQEPVAWYSKQYGFVYMSRQPSQFEHGSILYLRNGTPAWRIEGSSKVALLDIASLPHGTVFYALPGAQIAPKPAPSVPEGCKLTPINPDHQMLTAGNRWANGLAYETYVAMITAAPETKP